MKTQQKHTDSILSSILFLPQSFSLLFPQFPSILLRNNLQCSTFQLTSEVKDQLQMEKQRSVSEVGGAPSSPLPPRELRRSHFNPPPSSRQTPPCRFSPPCFNTNIRGQVWALSTSDQTRAAAGCARLRTVGLIGLEAPRWAKGHLQ